MTDLEFGVTRDRYASFVREAQKAFDAFGIEHRVASETTPDGRIYSYFQAFWDDWLTLGQESNALTSEASRIIYGHTLDHILFQAAGEVSR